MPDPQPDLQGDPSDAQQPARLLTPAEAAAQTGLTRRQITGRMDRGTLRVIVGEDGTRRVPRAELARVGLLDAGQPGESPNGSPGQHGELVVWRDLYERERQEHDATRERLTDRADEERRRGDELRIQLTVIANAGPFRALRLRRQLRSVSAADPSQPPPAGA